MASGTRGSSIANLDCYHSVGGGILFGMHERRSSDQQANLAWNRPGKVVNGDTIIEVVQTEKCKYRILIYCTVFPSFSDFR